ncbi:FCS-Like Zinc finger 18-like protein [Drosera capensis]
MLSIARRALNTAEPTTPQEERAMAVGLRILTQASSQGGESNILIKPAVRFSSTGLQAARRGDGFDEEFGSFLRCCSLCRNTLKPEKDVYMYRGDQGFCSIQCRDRQIAMDEAEEKRASTTKKIVTSAPYRPECVAGDQCETCKLLEEMRSRRQRRQRR